MSSTPEKSPEEIITDTPMDELMSETKSDEPLVNTYTDDEGHIISKTKWRKLQWHKSHPNA